MSTRGWVKGPTVGLAVVVMLALASCSHSDTTTSSGAAAPTAQDLSGGVDAAGSPAAGAADQASQSGQSPLGAVQQPAERKLIRNGDMALAVAGRDDVDRVADASTAAANDAGGRVDGDKRVGGDSPTADLVLRVPPGPARDRRGQDRHAGDGHHQLDPVRRRHQPYTDLEGRVGALQTSTARLRGFLSEATDANQIASLEGELTQREGQLESLQGQLRALSAKTDLATLKVAVRIQQPGPPAVATNSAPAPLEALAGGWNTFRIDGHLDPRGGAGDPALPRDPRGDGDRRPLVAQARHARDLTSRRDG